MESTIVADIGGTNARFAIIKKDLNGTLSSHSVEIKPTREFSCFYDAFSSWLSTLNERPTTACIAVAGPVDGDQVTMTNLNWSISKAELRNRFAFQQVELINDFSAMACSLPHISEQHLSIVKKGNPIATANRLVIGPGTGLGVASLIPHKGRWIPISGEGGHANLPSSTDDEAAIIDALRHRGLLHAEAVLSGIGLVNLASAMADIEGTSHHYQQPSDIPTAAANGDEFAVKVLRRFHDFFASYAADCALITGARGGVYIAGGVFKYLSHYVNPERFQKRFSNKGAMTDYLKDIPVMAMSDEPHALIGAGAYMFDHLK